MFFNNPHWTFKLALHKKNHIKCFNSNESTFKKKILSAIIFKFWRSVLRLQKLWW